MWFYCCKFATKNAYLGYTPTYLYFFYSKYIVFFGRNI